MELTNGLANSEDILREEVAILKALHWKLTPITIVSWLELYMQTAALPGTSASFFADLRYSKQVFYHATQVSR